MHPRLARSSVPFAAGFLSQQHRLPQGAILPSTFPFFTPTMPFTIAQTEIDAKGSFYAEQAGQRVAEMTYSRTNPTMVIVDHTHVDPSLSGQGVGRELLNALVQWARSTGTRVVPLCPFAKAQFDKDPSLRDVLV
jgi:predicted GNAT family acetyltransferase